MAKRETVFERSYSDKSGELSLTHDGETGFSGKVTEIHGAANLPVPSAGASGLMRYAMDMLVSVGAAAMKAQGGTIASAWEKIAETWEAFKSGEVKFRSAAGSASLSIEEEFAVIAEAIVAEGKAPDKETALAKVETLYNRTKQVTRKDSKGVEKQVTTRPDYNALRNVPQIKAALAKAQTSGEDKLGALMAD
jgi:hypothetical protein